MSKLHRIDTSTLKPGECCTHNCNEGRNCPANAYIKHRQRQKWFWHIPLAANILLLAWWLWVAL